MASTAATATTRTIPGTAASRGRPTTRRSWRAAPATCARCWRRCWLRAGTPMLSMGDEVGRTPGRQQQRLCAGQRRSPGSTGRGWIAGCWIHRAAGAGAAGASGAACRGAADRPAPDGERPAGRRLAAAGWDAARPTWGDADGAQPGRGVLRAGAGREARRPRAGRAAWRRRSDVPFVPPAPRPGFAWQVLADSADPAAAGRRTRAGPAQRAAAGGIPRLTYVPGLDGAAEGAVMRDGGTCAKAPARDRPARLAARRRQALRQRHAGACRASTSTSPSGEFLSLLGPSGCGKSHLAADDRRLGEPTAGTHRLAERPAAAPRDIGFVFQEPTLMPWATALDNVILPLRLAGVPARRARETAPPTALAQVGLAGFEKRLSARAVGRHEDARLDRPRPGHAAAAAADGRAVRRARRDHPLQAQQRPAELCGRRSASRWCSSPIRCSRASTCRSASP